MPGDRCGRGHRRTHQVRATTLALAAFEIAVRRAGAPLTRLQDVRVHTQAHATASLAPLEARFGEDAIDPFPPGRALALVRPRHAHRAHARVDAFAAHPLRCRAQVFEPRVGARADKDAVQLDVLD